MYFVQYTFKCISDCREPEYTRKIKMLKSKWKKSMPRNMCDVLFPFGLFDFFLYFTHTFWQILIANFSSSTCKRCSMSESIKKTAHITLSNLQTNASLPPIFLFYFAFSIFFFCCSSWAYVFFCSSWAAFSFCLLIFRLSCVFLWFVYRI